MKRQILAGAAVLALVGWAQTASAADVYDACMNANEPTATGAEQEALCKCITDGIGDNAALQEEAVALAAMTQADREANASEEANAVIGACAPEQPADAG